MNDDLRARRRYARSLKHRAAVKYLDDGKVLTGYFLRRVKGNAGVIVSTGTASKHLDISRLVLPAKPPKAAKPKKKPVKRAREMPSHMRHRLGIGLS